MRRKIPRGPKPPQLQTSDKQAGILEQIIRRASNPQNLVLRAKIVRAATKYGRRNTQIGQELNCSSQMVHTWRHRWRDNWERLLAIESSGHDQELETAIVDVLSDRPRPGTPPTFSAEQVCQIIAVACEDPELSGRPITEWTPGELANEVIKREIVSSISSSQVWRFLKQGGVETASKPVLAEQ